jgi:iron complex outermembrane receptor protein/hemoglobin/transferrin/lactoferrin receptor protein
VGPTYGGGLSWSAPRALSLHLNLEQGLAFPNLDDLTARQLTGQGFQVENPALAPERATTYEVGATLKAMGAEMGAEAEVWGFAMELTDGIERRDATCPPTDLGCQGSRTAPPFTLVNLPGAAWIIGFEHALTLKLPLGLTLREHISYARGEGPSPLAREPNATRPLSRVPPLNGAASLRWSPPTAHALMGSELTGYIGYEARWSRAATRLSFGDQIDQRIPYGGTPASLTHGALFGLRWGAHELLGVVENLTDVPYRTHGSSVNGAARSLNISLRLAL